MIKDLQKVVEQDPLAQLDLQDKELIWQMRYLVSTSGSNCPQKQLWNSLTINMQTSPSETLQSCAWKC